jgi:hypothetical protein
MSNFLQTVIVDTFRDNDTPSKPAFLRGQAKFQKIFSQCLSGFKPIFGKLF